MSSVTKTIELSYAGETIYLEDQPGDYAGDLDKGDVFRLEQGKIVPVDAGSQAIPWWTVKNIIEAHGTKISSLYDNKEPNKYEWNQLNQFWFTSADVPSSLAQLENDPKMRVENLPITAFRETGGSYPQAISEAIYRHCLRGVIRLISEGENFSTAYAYGLSQERMNHPKAANAFFDNASAPMKRMILSASFNLLTGKFGYSAMSFFHDYQDKILQIFLWARQNPETAAIANAGLCRVIRNAPISDLIAIANDYLLPALDKGYPEQLPPTDPAKLEVIQAFWDRFEKSSPEDKRSLGRIMSESKIPDDKNKIEQALHWWRTKIDGNQITWTLDPRRLETPENEKNKHHLSFWSSFDVAMIFGGDGDVSELNTAINPLQINYKHAGPHSDWLDPTYFASLAEIQWSISDATGADLSLRNRLGVALGSRYVDYEAANLLSFYVYQKNSVEGAFDTTVGAGIDLWTPSVIFYLWPGIYAEFERNLATDENRFMLGARLTTPLLAKLFMLPFKNSH